MNIVSGVASLAATANNIAGGPYNVTASTAGASSASFTLTNTQATTTVITPSTASITAGQSATFTAAVSSSTGTPSDGTVQFFVNGSAYGSAVAVNNGQAQESITEATAGNYSITAQYLGDSTTYAASPVSAAVAST